MARPKKQPAEKRSASIRADLTMAEKVFVQEQAVLAGLSEAEYTRRRVLGLAVQPRQGRANAALIVELNRIGNNVNQLARAVHRGRDLPEYWRAVGKQLEHALVEIVLAGNHDPAAAAEAGR